jgi:hypothetical protein
VHANPAHEGVPVLTLQSTPQAPQLVVVVVEVEQPAVLGGAGLQSAKPAAQLEYEHVVPLQVGPTLWDVSHTLPQPPQLVVLVRLVSQPLVSGATLSQLAKPGSQLVYSHEVPLQEAPTLCIVSHASPQPEQFVVVVVGVEQPAVLGGVGLQSAKPGSQPVYEQVELVQVAPTLCVVSHVSPQAPQFMAPPVAVSQPSTSGAAVMQSAKPMEQPVYWHVVPLHAAPMLWTVSHVAPHAAQLVMVLVAVSQPFVSGAVVSQSA